MSSKELLAEYAKLEATLKHINGTLQEMNSVDVTQLIDKIRIVERKMGLVYTLFKSSVYSVTMQQPEQDQDQDQDQEQDRRNQSHASIRYQDHGHDRQ